MAREHIVERGDKRQYFEKYTPEIDNLGEIAGIINQGLQSAVTITQKANESTLASNQIDLSTKFLAENNKINTKYQADPTNPEREKELREAFDLLSSQYKVNAACQKQWNDIKTNVYDKYKTYNAQWVEKQQQTNIQTNLQNGYENLINQVSMLGMNGAGVDEIRLIYANGIEGLKNGATAGLGEVVVNDFLKDSNHDIMTTYISALALNNPLQAQALLKDEGVRNDIGRAETLEKLESYVSNSLLNQSKRNAVNELGNTLRAMNSDEAKAIMNGEADLNSVTKFIETNKKLPRGSKDLILGIYGIGSKTDYYYDVDNDKIVKKEDLRAGGDYGGGYSGGYSRGGRRGRKGHVIPISKASKEQKNTWAAQLAQEVYDTFSFQIPDKVNPKDVIKNKNGDILQSNVLKGLQQVAYIQGKIDRCYGAGIIDKNGRNAMMSKFLDPMINYLQANMQELDEKSSPVGAKLGFDRLKKEFNVGAIAERNTRQRLAMKKNLLVAEASYYESLDTARRKMGLNSIYDLENLAGEAQRKIYKKAADDAITFAKRYGDHPEAFFKQEYPQLYAQGCDLFGEEDGEQLAKIVAKQIYNAPEGQKVDPRAAMGKAISEAYVYKFNKNFKTKERMREKDLFPNGAMSEFVTAFKDKNNTLKDTKTLGAKAIKAIVSNYKNNKHFIPNREDVHSAQQKFNREKEEMYKYLNVSKKDVQDTMKATGMSEAKVLTILEMNKNKRSIGEYYK